jgi:hypothetical protein
MMCRIKEHLHKSAIENTNLPSSSREIVNQLLLIKIESQKRLGKLDYRMEVGSVACYHFNITIYLMEVTTTTFSIMAITRPMMLKTLHP